MVDDRALYVLGEHVVYAFDKTTGAPLWTTPLPDGPNELLGYGTALAAGLLIIGDIDVFGIDPATGVIRWTFAPRLTYPNERSFQRLTTDGTTVYIGGVWGNVYAVDAATGVQKWVAHVTTLPDSVVRVFNPALDRGTVYVAFADQPLGTLKDNGGAAAIDAVTGQLLWSQFLPSRFSEVTESTDITLTPTRAVVGSLDGYLYGLDRQTGAIIDTISQTVFGFPAGYAASDYVPLCDHRRHRGTRGNRQCQDYRVRRAQSDASALAAVLFRQPHRYDRGFEQDLRVLWRGARCRDVCDDPQIRLGVRPEVQSDGGRLQCRAGARQWPHLPGQ